LTNFNSIDSWVNSVDGKLDSLSRKIVLDIDSEVVRQSPFDEGTFRANWQLGINSIPTGVLDETDITGSNTARKHVGQMPQKAAGNVYYLVNNLPYAVPLADGHSSQAEKGWIDRIVLNFENKVQEISVSLK